MLRRVTHEHARALLPSYATGALDFATAAAVRHHLVAGCRECLRDLFRQPVRPEPSTRIEPSSHAEPPAHIELPAPAEPPIGARSDAPTAHPGRAIARSTAAARHVAPAVRRFVVAASLAVIAAAGLRGWAIVNRLENPAPRSARLADVDVLAPDDVTLAPRHPTVSTRAGTAAVISARTGAAGIPPGDGAAHNETAAGSDRARPGGDDTARSGAEPPMIRYADGVLSMRVVNMPLPDVLQAIARQAGVVLRGPSVEARDVNIRFENVPFVQALRRLLGLRNFVLTYDGGRPRVLEVLDQSGAPAAATTTAKTAVEGAPEAAQSIAALLDSRPSVPLSTNLVQALGKRAMSLRQLLDLAVNHVDKGVRGIAMRAAVEALQTDPELRAAMFGSRPGMRDGIFGALVQGMERERAQEALFYVAMQARDSELRNGAATLIQRIATFGTSRTDG